MRDNQNPSQMSRRALIASLAAGATVALPSIASAVAAHPDRELIALGGEYDRLLHIKNEAYDHQQACCQAYEEVAPIPRDVMRHTLEDWFMYHLPVCEGTTSLAADIRHGSFYLKSEIDLLPYAPPTQDPADMPAAKARATDIAKEFARWTAECEALMESCGVHAAARALAGAIAAHRAMAGRIAFTPAKTLAGLQVRATIVAQIYDDGMPDIEHLTTDEQMMWSIVRDLVAIDATESV